VLPLVAPPPLLAVPPGYRLVSRRSGSALAGSDSSRMICFYRLSNNHLLDSRSPWQGVLLHANPSVRSASRCRLGYRLSRSDLAPGSLFAASLRLDICAWLVVCCARVPGLWRVRFIGLNCCRALALSDACRVGLTGAVNPIPALATSVRQFLHCPRCVGTCRFRICFCRFSNNL
jgi:hypothetical protein